MLSRENLADRAISYVFRDNAETLRVKMDELEVGDWSPWFDVALKAREGWAGRMNVKRLGDDSFYVSPFYRSDEGVEMSYPTGFRKAVSERLCEQYIPEGPGWSKHAEPETPEYLFEHLVDV